MRSTLTADGDEPTRAKAHAAGEFRIAFIACVLAAMCIAAPAAAAEKGAPRKAVHAEEHQHESGPTSLADHRIDWPTWQEFARVITLRDYNTRVVLLGTMLLGMVSGVVGTFMLLRKRALIGDVVSHSALPGIGLAFIIMEMHAPGSGKWLPGLLTGALVAGLSGMAAVLLIRKSTAIKEDAALAIVLSVFFGLGVVLFTIIQSLPTGNSAGLGNFIYGQAGAIVADDVRLIAKAAGLVLVISVLLFKEFEILCFDQEFAAAQGWPVMLLDLVLMGLVAGVTVIGLQSVGLLLVVALLIIPPAAARFWTDHLRWMTLASAALGGLSGLFGVLFSALFPRMAAGAVIVLVGSVFFLFSIVFGTRRGIVRRALAHWRLKARIDRQHLLRAVFECLEDAPPQGSNGAPAVPFKDLLEMRSWTASRLEHLLVKAAREGLVERVSPHTYTLTRSGLAAAHRVVRNHRLWELYLITYADVAPSRVDRDADQIEHILEPELIDELETLLSEKYPEMAVPPSPHAISLPARSSAGPAFQPDANRP